MIKPASLDALILTLRGQKVLLDADLAALYGVLTKRLNEQVKRNAERFREDFVFQLNAAEAASLRSQFPTSKRGGRRTLPPVPPTKELGFHMREKAASYGAKRRPRQ